jgi:hypothetical protein
MAGQVLEPALGGRVAGEPEPAAYPDGWLGQRDGGRREGGFRTARFADARVVRRATAAAG